MRGPLAVSLGDGGRQLWFQEGGSGWTARIQGGGNEGGRFYREAFPVEVMELLDMWMCKRNVTTWRAECGATLTIKFGFGGFHVLYEREDRTIHEIADLQELGAALKVLLTRSGRATETDDRP